ncbi:DNA-binding MarR family transcriptional regulator [Kitasatospora sp. GAS204A]|uniref:MarR family winged helix-turn-helix transcriptional regulator n=1 Tax=unclassified Kitasatospora TaxID=2633591 RepID=UPI0024762CA5|nr:MarR family transcriptional regulator [Kitasatospora sp. GAS204B]MDH6119058.1 DNA-binding MarR family transcriptional regulator [Kitasatospora sp. GAS204B]
MQTTPPLAADPPPGDSPEELAATLRLIVGRIARRVRQAHISGDLAHSEVSVLARLDREGANSPGALAELERVRPQAMATTLAGLEERGLVSRRPDPSDGRRVIMTLTGAGRQVLTERRSESVRLLAATLGTEFTDEERQQLRATLPLLERLAEGL